jgi:hypothetical protein
MLSIGADPEVFLKDRYTGKYVSAVGIIPGSKQFPEPVLQGAVQRDGMAAEFNIDPAILHSQFERSMTSVMRDLASYADLHNCELAFDPVARFSPEVMASQPEDALALGCEPDINAWTGEENPKPEAVGDMANCRTGSFHVHFGYYDPNHNIHDPRSCFEMVKQLDFSLGLVSLLYDDCVERRKLYGKAGACRVKPYGGEYRVLSNAMLKTVDRRRLVYYNTKWAFNTLIVGNVLAAKYGDISDIINNSDVKEAKKIIKRADIPLINDYN